MKNIKYNLITKSIFSFAIICLFFISCNNKNETTNEEQADEAESHEVALTEIQFNTIGIKTGSTEMKNLNTAIKANGYTTVPPQNSANISTLIGGVVKDIFVLEGTYVAKGKTLATIQNLEITEMQEEYNAAIANIEYLQLEFDRQKTLTDENVNARKTFQEIKAKLAVENARAQAAKIKLQTLNVGTKISSSVIPIISPISGYVGKINVTKGAYAATGTSLFEVVDNSQMHLDLNVYEKDLSNISIGQEVDFVLTNQSNKSIKGKIFGINKSFSNESKTVAVHAKINPSDAKDLISGMYVSANININNATVEALPKDAIVKDGDKYYIFVQEDEQEEAKEAATKKADNHSHNHDEKVENHNEIHFKAIEVLIGTTDLGYTEVKFIEKIDVGAKIVVNGAFYLLSAMKGGGSHEH